MIKISINSFEMYKFLYKYSLLRKFIHLDLRVLETIASSEDFSFAVSRFTGANNHGKITEVGRFIDITGITSRCIDELQQRLKLKIKIHDIGVSSGITSCELFEAIKNVPTSFYISDVFTNYLYSGRRIAKIFDSKNNFIYGYIFFALADKNTSKVFFISKFLYYILNKIDLRSDKIQVSFLDKKTKFLIDNRKLIFIDYDVFESTIKNEFHFIRCMNVLNRNSWFSDRDIALALSNISDSMQEGGVLLIGRTDDVSKVTNAGFYIKTQGKFQLIQSVNQGSEVHNIVMGLK